MRILHHPGSRHVKIFATGKPNHTLAKAQSTQREEQEIYEKVKFRLENYLVGIAVYYNLQEIPSYQKLLRALRLCESKSFTSTSRRVQ